MGEFIVKDLPSEKIRSLQQLFNRMVANKTSGDKLPKFALLAGAGCSISSGVASGSRIIDILQKYNYLLDTDSSDSELLSKWNHEKESLETFISKVEHLIDPNLLNKYISLKNAEHYHQYENIDLRSRLLNTLPNSLKKQYPAAFKQSGENMQVVCSEAVDPIWSEFSAFFLDELKYGFWMYQYSPVKNDIQALIEEFIEHRNPSIEYYLFADLVAKGVLYNIFTTNFDDFFQESLSFLGMRAHICSFEDKADVINYTRKKANIIKLHGDYLYNNTKNYNSETSELHASLKSKFQEALMKFGMIVVGYAGNDYSIMSVLEELKEHLDYPLYWCILESDLVDGKIPWRAKELILHTNDSYFVPISSFGQFADYLWRKWNRAEVISQCQTESFIVRAFEKATSLSQQLKIVSEENSEKPLSNGTPLSTLVYDYSKILKPPTVSPLATFSGEVVTVQDNGFIHLQEAVKFFNNLDSERKELAKCVIRLIGDYIFLNARYLTFLLNEEGIAIRQDKTLNMLQRLFSANILSRYKFSSPSTTSNFYVFSLAYNGDKLYRQWFKIKPQWNATLKLSSAMSVKKHLAVAQIVSTIKRYAGNVSHQISSIIESGQTRIRPSASYKYVKKGVEHRYLLEVVRRSPNWENDILEKLGRYNSYLTKYLLESPSYIYLILCGEDRSHMEEIFNVYETWRKNARDKMLFDQLNERRVWFTEDIAFLSHKLKNTFVLLYRNSEKSIEAVSIDLNSYFDMDDRIEQNMPDYQDDEIGEDENEDTMYIGGDCLPEDPNAYTADGEENKKMLPPEYKSYDTLKKQIVRTLLVLGDVEQPVPLAQFALKLKKSGVDYHEYGFSKLIKLLQSQDTYIAIEGTGADKYIKLINSPLNIDCIEEQRLLIEQEMQKTTYYQE